MSVFGPLTANVKRGLRQALGLRPKKRGLLRWNKKRDRTGRRYYTAGCRPLDCGLIVSPDRNAGGWVLKTISDGEFVEIRNTYTARGARHFAERWVKAILEGRRR